MSDPSGARHRVVAAATDGGARLDKWLAQALPQLSRARIQALIAEGLVSSGGRTLGEPAIRVKPGQSFDVVVPQPRLAAPEPQPMALVIAYEDEALLVVDKPAGLVVHPAPGNPDRTLVNALLAHCGPSLTGIGGVARPGIVHRLDKDTSGLMVVAKTETALNGLAAQFADRSLSRRYLAVVRGRPRPASGIIDRPIARSPANRKKMAVVAGGRRAVTHYRVLRPLGTLAGLVECLLETGRTHQIRVHLAAAGHGVVGDQVYGGAVKGTGPETALLRQFPRQALHAAGLSFRHPLDDRAMAFESQLPADIAWLIQSLELFETDIPERFSRL